MTAVIRDHTVRVADLLRRSEVVELNHVVVPVSIHGAQGTDGEHLVGCAGFARKNLRRREFLAHPEHFTSAARWDSSRSENCGIRVRH